MIHDVYMLLFNFGCVLLPLIGTIKEMTVIEKLITVIKIEPAPYGAGSLTLDFHSY